jgi:hypothetical protein
MLRQHSSNELCAPLGYCAANSGDPLPKFRDELLDPIFKGQEIQEDCPETSVENYQHRLRRIPDEHRTRLLRGGSLNLKSGTRLMSAGLSRHHLNL